VDKVKYFNFTKHGKPFFYNFIFFKVYKDMCLVNANGVSGSVILWIMILDETGFYQSVSDGWWNIKCVRLIDYISFKNILLFLSKIFYYGEITKKFKRIPRST